MNITSLFHQQAKKISAHNAIIDDHGIMTYGQLSESINEMAAMLEGFGIRAGMGVGVLGANGRYFVIMAYAVMQCGAVVLPLSNQLKKNELDEVMKSAGLHAIIFEEDDQEAFRAFNKISLNAEPWKICFIQTGQSFFPVAPHITNAALIRFTSGTTGTSKGVILSHETILARIIAANSALQLSQDDVVLWVLSMAYHFVVSIILYLHHGATIVVCNDFMATAILEKVNNHKATFLYAAPVHIRMLANDAGNMKLDSVKTVISTSSGISKDQCDSFYSRYAVPVSQAYGIIEIGLPIINLDKSISDPDAIGYAVDSYEVSILDDEFNGVHPGTIGNLAIKGPGMLDGYLSPPTTRDTILQHGWFMTGDLASKNNDGLIKVEGRKKSMINVAGNKVFPEDVESVLNRHPAIQLSRVSGYKHPLLGESVQAELLVKPGQSIPDVEEIRRYCRESLSPHKIPQKVLFVTELPMTDSGKLIRH